MEITSENDEVGTPSSKKKKPIHYEIPQPITKEYYVQAYAITHPGPSLLKPPCIDTLHKVNQLEGLAQQVTRLVNQKQHALSEESRFVCDRMRYVELPKGFTERDKEAFCRRRDERRNGIHVYQQEILARIVMDYIELKTFKGTDLL